MRFIKELCEFIKEETQDACKYAKLAVQLKAEGKPNAAQLFYEIANQEVNHAGKIHELAIKEVNAAKASGAEIPAGMEQIWRWKHDEMMEDMAHAKSVLSLYSK